MITTPRSLAVGLAAWFFAFGVVYLARINPVHLTIVDVIIVGACGVAGFAGTVALARRFCRRDFEWANAVMVFALAFFAGIYAPISAIWANAPYYGWVERNQTSPKSHEHVLHLAAAVEKTALCQYLGAFLILGLGYLLARRVQARRPASNLRRPPLASCSKDDIALGLINFVGGALFASKYGCNSPVQWVGYVGGCFLVFLLIRSLRSQFVALKDAFPLDPRPPLSLPSTVVGLLCLLGCWSLLPIWVRLFDREKLTDALFFIPGTLLLWIVFRAVAGKPSENTVQRLATMGRPVIGTACWGGLGWSAVIMGLVLPGIAQRELNQASEIPLPFALTVLALKPLFWTIVLPGGVGLFGGWLMPLCLPRQAQPSERILVSAQGGAAMGAVLHVSLVMFALNLAMLTVNAMPSGHHTQLLHHWLDSGEWITLSLRNMTWLLVLVIGVATVWASEAAITVGVNKIWRQVRQWFPSTARNQTIPSPTLAKNPPTEPSA